MTPTTTTIEPKNTTSPTLATSDLVKLTRLKEQLKAPGTKLGYLVRRLESVLADLNECVQAYGGGEVQVKHFGQAREPIRSVIAVGVTVQAGDHVVQESFTFSTMPIVESRIVDDSEPAFGG